MSTRGPKDIQVEVSDARHSLDRTLDAIESRFTPGHAIDMAYQYVRGGAGGFAENFSNTVQNNPIPITLLGVGLAWLMASDVRPEPARNSGGSSAREALDRAGDKASKVGDKASELGDKARNAGDRAKGAGDRAMGKAQDVRDRAGNAASGARERMERWGESGRYQAQRARANAGQLMRDNPLAIGALGIALGAALAAALPPTRQEDAAMGSLRDESLRKAKNVGSDYAERAKPVAEAAKSEAKKETDKQGLNPERSGEKSGSKSL